VLRIIRRDLKLRQFKRTRVHSITEASIAKRLQRCKDHLSGLSEPDIRKTLWTDEKMFVMNNWFSTQNCRVYGSAAKPKKQLSGERLMAESSAPSFCPKVGYFALII
jgi:hypothetical protein